MTDKHSKEARSYNMSRVRGKNTQPELVVRRFLYSKGFRYRLHDKKLPGTPNIILSKYKTVIFINGCFWHGHENCRYATIPKTRSEWWEVKIKKNTDNDKMAQARLKSEGWQVILIWGCELKAKSLIATLHKIPDLITSNLA